VEHESVAALRHGLQQFVRVVPYGTPYFVNALNQAVVGNGDSLPDGFQELAFCDQPVSVLDQVSKGRKGLRPQRQFLAPARNQRLIREIGNYTANDDCSGWNVHLAVDRSTTIFEPA
jgi:hypothetical protein